LLTEKVTYFFLYYIMAKIYNPSTERYIKDTTANRNRIEAIAKQELFNIASEDNKRKEKTMIDNFWDTFIQPAIIQEKIAKSRLKKERKQKVLTIRAKNQELERTLQTRQNMGALKRYRFTYSIKFYKEGDLYTRRGNMRDGAVVFEDRVLQAVNREGRIIIASRVRLQSKIYEQKNDGEMSKAIDKTDNQRFQTYYRNLTISDDIEAMEVYNEQPIAEIRNIRNATDTILYQTEHIAVSEAHNYFELDIDKTNKTFRSNALIGGVNMCLYNVCMKLGEKINERLKSEPYKVTMESIANVSGVTERYANGDYGLTVNEVLLWFQKYNISLSCYDIFWKQIFHWENNGKDNKHKLKACSILIHNGHAYYLSENARRSLTKKQELNVDEAQLPKPSDAYKVKKEHKCTKKADKKIERVNVYKKCNTIDEVFEAVFSMEENENLNIYCIVEDLMEVVRKMIFDYGITPNVNGKMGHIKSIDLNLVNNFVRIFTIHTQMIPMDVLASLTIEEYTLYCKERDDIANIIINNKYKSTYNDRVKNAFHHYTRGSVRGLCADNVDMEKEYYGLDSCKSYGNLMHNLEYIPIFSSFDDFVTYNGEEVHPYYFYMVRKVNEFNGSDLIFDTNEIMTTGTTVLYLSKKAKIEFTILAVLKPSRLVLNPLYGEIKKIFENTNYNVFLKKFLVNSIIGLLGRKLNTYRKMIISTDKNYIMNICQAYGELGISTFPMQLSDDYVYEEDEKEHPALYAFYNEQSTQLSNGFYPIQFMIYDMQRISVFKSYKEVSMFTKPIAVNTDCVYFEKCEKLDAYIKEKYDGSFGSKKLERPKLLFMYNKIYRERESKLEDIIYDYKQNLIHINNEYDLKEIASKLENFTIITSDIAGSGKSYCLQHILDKSKTLYVTPYNKLAFTLRTNGFKATTFARLTGCAIEGIIEVERTELDLTGIENIVFEEIYTYDLYTLQNLVKYTNKHKTVSFYATGDTFQLESITNKMDFEYIDEAIRKIFRNNIHFRIHKRDPKAHDFLVMLKRELFDPNNWFRLVDVIKKYFKVVGKEFVSEKAVCYFNDTCEVVNNIIMNKRRGNSDLSINDELICRQRLTTKVGDLIPNYIYRVIEITDDLITLFEPFEEVKYIVKKHTVHNHFKFQWSETAHSIQGETFKEKITVYDINEQNICLTARWAYVALTRSSNIDNVTICCDEIHNNNIQGLDEKLKAYDVSDKQKGFVFNEKLYPRITRESFKSMLKKQRSCCAVCGCQVKTNWGFSGDVVQYSIDRIDNDFIGGHCQQNVQITCLLCNVTKK
jgi:hypothetical protein